MPPSLRYQDLLAAIDEAFDHKSWHGTNLRGSLRGLSAACAVWRPGPERHNIWENAVHAAYWKYAVRRRLTGERRGSFPLPGSNWFARPAPGSRNLESLWREDVALLVEEHRQLREGITGLKRGPADPVPGSSLTVGFLLRGIAAHDLYHAGQIQLLKRLQR